jgi:hypothetical protein
MTDIEKFLFSLIPPNMAGGAGLIVTEKEAQNVNMEDKDGS